jgi:hypothetical protein
MRGIIKIASQDFDNELLIELSAIKQSDFNHIMSFDGSEDLNLLKKEVRNNYPEHHNLRKTNHGGDPIVLPLDLSLTL